MYDGLFYLYQCMIYFKLKSQRRCNILHPLVLAMWKLSSFTKALNISIRHPLVLAHVTYQNVIMSDKRLWSCWKQLQKLYHLRYISNSQGWRSEKLVLLSWMKVQLLWSTYWSNDLIGLKGNAFSLAWQEIKKKLQTFHLISLNFGVQWK